MHIRPLWNDFASFHEFPALQTPREVDVAIIGAGITGISTAQMLAAKGWHVAVLESFTAGSGTTGHSTGNMYCMLDVLLSGVRSKYDLDTVKMLIASRNAALDKIESWVRDYNLDCDFRRQPWYLYSALAENNKKIEDEFEAAQEAGIAVTAADHSEFRLPVEKAIKVPGQAQVNPARYVQELAKAVVSDRLGIYEHTRVTAVEENDDHVTVRTTRGDVRAKYVVHATHTPKGIKLVQTLLGPYREYGIACQIEDRGFPGGIFWGYHEEGKKFSTRVYERDGKSFLVVVGEPHKVGQGDSGEHMRNLEVFARKHFGVKTVNYRWGGQHYRPADLLPYIGRSHPDSRSFIATGYSTDGLVYGTLAGMLITDALQGTENEWNELYNPTRFQPVKAAGNFLKENINAAVQYLKDLPRSKIDPLFESVGRDQGKILEYEGSKVAAYRDREGTLRLVSATCPHLRCTVHWNDAEKSWDCPCHGSRFAPHGTVLEGPALSPLEPVQLHEPPPHEKQ